MTSPTLAAYETFEMDFDLGKKYGRLLTKNKRSSSKKISPGSNWECCLFDDVDDDDTDHNVKGASLTSVYLGMLVVSSRNGGGLEPPTTLFHLPAPPPRKKPPTRGDKQPHSEHKGW